MSVSPQSHQVEASIPTNNTQARFGLDRMEEYYVAFKKKRSIYAEYQFEVDSLKFLPRYPRPDWNARLGPFTIPIDPYFLELLLSPPPTPPNLLKIAQRAYAHENHLVKLAKAIPSMIHTVNKKAMQPAKNKLKSLCSTVEVLESEVISLRKEVSALCKPLSTSNSNPSKPAAVPVQLEAPRSPPDDWWVGYDNTSEIVSDEELYHS
ncbi:hypothetical protein HAX54_031265 [Datura stramonium]|uniref:Mediator of RNA polymerase II transcription subunit 7 n=1 Tax=Datura stramonium TaxID=4076 RepID=A0ABS8SBV0_DATST|nr:hypothetical protein [Datura stramonium]